jgi:membrane protein implicated in regulation of membrane protease activity
VTLATVWWLLAGLAIVAELLSGTFYLLMLALGLAAAALSAHAGAGLTLQVVTAALVGGGAVLVWGRHRANRAPEPPAAQNPAVNLDIGQTVQVDRWLPDGSAHVHYRGTDWTARPAPGSTVPAPGPHRIVAVEGSILIVQPA